MRNGSSDGAHTLVPGASVADVRQTHARMRSLLVLVLESTPAWRQALRPRNFSRELLLLILLVLICSSALGLALHVQIVDQCGQSLEDVFPHPLELCWKIFGLAAGMKEEMKGNARMPEGTSKLLCGIFGGIRRRGRRVQGSRFAAVGASCLVQLFIVSCPAHLVRQHFEGGDNLSKVFWIAPLVWMRLQSLPSVCCPHLHRCGSAQYFQNVVMSGTPLWQQVWVRTLASEASSLGRQLFRSRLARPLPSRRCR
mmetsp:Transcript_115609/g.204838  ORF Transcript_115609/g.204838 Transcript_115609/m.204838 type:complete len:254 (-) Transcript_115609:588-1349(-)